MKLRFFLSFLLAVVGLGLVAGCGKEDSVSAPLRVGMDLSYPPFETIGPDGRPSGISVDLARALGEYLDRPVHIENIPFTGLLPSLQTGKIDLILSSMTDTPARRETVDFSDPYLRVGLALLVGKDSPIENVEDLDQPGRVVAVRQGTTGQVWAEANLRNARVLVLEKENAAVLEVIQGKADAFVYDQMSVWKNCARSSSPFRWKAGLWLCAKATTNCASASTPSSNNSGNPAASNALATNTSATKKKPLPNSDYPFIFNFR
jgi:polar amino acid transport system substrate-binding protein